MFKGHYLLYNYHMDIGNYVEVVLEDVALAPSRVLTPCEPRLYCIVCISSAWADSSQEFMLKA